MQPIFDLSCCRLSLCPNRIISPSLLKLRPVGRALITQPKLILADEPTGNLDSKNSQDVIDMLISASRHFKQTILMITHNNNLTSSVDRVFRVSDGILTDLGGTANEALS